MKSDTADTADAERATVTSDFAQFFGAQFAPMVRLAALLGADDPEDIAQEAFVRLEQRRHQLRDPAKARAYLRTSVVNLTRSRARHLTVVRRHATASPPVESAEVLALLSDERRRVITALRVLTARQRQVLILRYWMDLSERAIADTLGIRAGTVKSTAAKALAALARAMGDDDG